MHIPHRGRQKIHPGSNELLHLLRRGEHPLHVHRIRHAILTTLNAPRLGFRSDPARVAVRHQLFRLGQVGLLLVVRHVDHDGVEGERVRRETHEGLVLAVVQVDGNGDCGSRGGVGCGADEEAVCCADGPGEDLDD